jgi:hypothetical protein
MKLSCVLLLALAPVNAVDSQPANLRGIASIALSDEESAPVMVDGIDFVEESRYGGSGPNHNSCRGVTLWCSTSPTAMASHKCCENKNLTCQPSVHVKSEVGNSNAFDGTCVANGPGPAAPTAGARYGQACKTAGDPCNNTSGSATTKCCNDGVTYNLVCSASAGAGTCVEATPSAPGEIDE